MRRHSSSRDLPVRLRGRWGVGAQTQEGAEASESAVAIGLGTVTLGSGGRPEGGPWAMRDLLLMAKSIS
jgi:hypothetical protein